MNKDTIFSHKFYVNNIELKNIQSISKLLDLKIGDKIKFDKLYQIVDKEFHFIEDDKSIILRDIYYLA